MSDDSDPLGSALPPAARPGYFQLARLLVARALEIGAESAPEEGDGLGTLTNARGIRLQTRMWQAATPRALVVFCHGYGTSTTHNPAWHRVAMLLSQHGFMCCGLDYAGHGTSEGRRNRVESVDDLVDDVLQLVDQVVGTLASPLPVFLRGQSLGGIVALAAALRCPQRFVGGGLALGAPAFELRWLVSPFAPRAITTGAAQVRAQLHELHLPIACFQGVSDSTVQPSGARHLLAACTASSQRSLFLYAEMGHNMSIEPDVRDWMCARLEARDGGGRSAQSAVLHVRRPTPGTTWRPPPPGSEHANVNTVVEVVTEPAAQGQLLDALLNESTGGVPL